MRFLPAAFMSSMAGLMLLGSTAYAQRERQIPPPEAPSEAPPAAQNEGSDYSARFFDELQRIFGRFRDSDLKRVFDSARPVQCSELTTDKGEWREVAFFNENRKLGDWYRKQLEEVKADLAVYVFKGACGGPRAALQVTTKFPVQESYDRAADGRIPLSQVDVDVNAPVSVIFDPQTKAYTFELPYLYHIRSETGDMVYTLNPRTTSDVYARDVTDHWDCKAVTAEDVTYQFLICHNSLLPRDAHERYEDKGSFGSSAYSILSDGKEASSSVHLSFGDDEPAKPPTEARPAERSRNDRPGEFPPPAPSKTWRPVPSQANLSETGQSEFRLRFKPETWKGRIDRAQLVQDGMLAAFTTVPRNKDFCVWRPGAAAAADQLLDPAASTVVTLQFRKDPQAIITVFDIDSDSGAAAGSLQCSFAQAQTPASITVARWLSIVGSAVALESPGQ